MFEFLTKIVVGHWVDSVLNCTQVAFQLYRNSEMAKSINFTKLWERLKVEIELLGDQRLKAVVSNHEQRKEYICRKLGIISDADINRLTKQLRSKPRLTR